MDEHFDGWDRKESPSEDNAAEIRWVDASSNPWGVAVLDIRPITQSLTAFSSDPQCARNAVSFGSEDGKDFIGTISGNPKPVGIRPRFRTDGILADGVLFNPQAMEHKWALYYYDCNIICVRSWRREAVAVAATIQDGDNLEVTEIQGWFAEEHESPIFGGRVLDFLLRSHVLGLVYPAPLLPGLEKDPHAAAVWCFSCFGNHALVATPHEIAAMPPHQTLRTTSLLHIAVARGDLTAAEIQLEAGVPIDLFAQDGLSPLHWATGQDTTDVARFLIERGSHIDCRSAEGATPLMTAVQGGRADAAAFLLNNGADPNSRDARGFTSLHRAAELGNIDLVRLLLDRGADHHVEANGHTPRSLAEACDQSDIVLLLDAQ